MTDWEFNPSGETSKDVEAINGIIDRAVTAGSKEQKDMGLWETKRFIAMLAARADVNFDVMEEHKKHFRRIMGICVRMLPDSLDIEATETPLIEPSREPTP